MSQYGTDSKGVKKASKVDIVVKQQNQSKGPLTINLHLVNDETPVKVILDDKTLSPSPQNQHKLEPSRRIIIAIIIALAIILTVGIYATSNITTHNSDKVDVFQFVSRDEWNAQPTIETDQLELPVHRVIIAHTATDECNDKLSCIGRIKMIQNYHMFQRNLNDIIYNFLIGGDGAVYEGRGWNVQGAHTKGFNVDSICIAFIGTFSTYQPPEKQLKAAKWIIDEGVRLNKLAKDYRIYGARQLVATESPGKELYEFIKEWPNWSNKIV